MKLIATFLLTFVSFLAPLFAQSPSLEAMVAEELPSLVTIYRELHAAPELSFREHNTAARFAAVLKAAGYEVTENVGKTDRKDVQVVRGVVGVLKNGAGPTIYLRTDLDGLPVTEQTALPYASKVRATNDEGQEVGVMHACGHDLHMTSMIGTARTLAKLRNRWSGTLVIIGQPAEEIGAGAQAMLDDRLYERFGMPAAVVALHDHASLEAGKINVVEGYAFAALNSVNIIVRGVGGHGAYPHTAKDPVVVASQIVLALQTIVSREKSPLDPAVITVGSIHGGTKRNVIPDEVELKLTVRSYREDVRKQLLASIERVAKGVALAAGIPEDRAPIVEVTSESAEATYNDPATTRRLFAVWKKELGDPNVLEGEPVMGSEDFGRYALQGKVPICMFWLGAVDPAKVAAARDAGKTLPALHSPFFAPLPEPAIRTGVRAMTAAALDLLKKR